IRSSVVCDESKCLPMSGSATLATARLRFATAATRMSEISTIDARAGAASSTGAVCVSVMEADARSSAARASPPRWRRIRTEPAATGHHRRMSPQAVQHPRTGEPRTPEDAAALARFNDRMALPIVLAAVVPLFLLPGGAHEAIEAGVFVVSWIVFLVD